MSIKKSEKGYIYERDNRKCYYCGKPLRYRQITLDHYLPRSRGGIEVIYNLVNCCKSCNKLKKNIVPKDFEENIIRLFKKAYLDGMIISRSDIPLLKSEMNREILKIDRIEEIRDIIVFQSKDMRFYVNNREIERVIYIGNSV